MTYGTRELLDGFLKRYKAASARVYRSEIRAFLLWFQGRDPDGDLVGITEEALKEYGKHLSETAGAAAIRRRFSILNRFLTYAEKRAPSFTSPIRKERGAVQALQAATYAETEGFRRNLTAWSDTLHSKKTVEAYAGAVRRFFAWAGKAPGDLDQADFSAYREHLESERGLKPASVWAAFMAIKAFLEWMEAHRRLRNPLDFPALGLIAPPAGAGYHNVLTPEEVRRLMKAPDRRTLIGKRDHAMLMLFLVFGPRAGEIAALRWRDVDPGRVSGQQRIWFRSRKGRRGKRPDTSVILNGKALQAWDAWVENCGIRFEPDSPLFVGFRWDPRTRGMEINRRQVREKAPLTVEAIENVVRRHMEKARIVRAGRVLGPHALRHTALTEMSRAGIPVATIKHIAGHRNINTTMIYTHHGQDYRDNVGMHIPTNR